MTYALPRVDWQGRQRLDGRLSKGRQSLHQVHRDDRLWLYPECVCLVAYTLPMCIKFGLLCGYPAGLVRVQLLHSYVEGRACHLADPVVHRLGRVCGIGSSEHPLTQRINQSCGDQDGDDYRTDCVYLFSLLAHPVPLN